MLASIYNVFSNTNSMQQGPEDEFSVEGHYTTTPDLALDDLTPKAATTVCGLTLKTYSVRLLQTC